MPLPLLCSVDMSAFPWDALDSRCAATLLGKSPLLEMYNRDFLNCNWSLPANQQAASDFPLGSDPVVSC